MVLVSFHLDLYRTKYQTIKHITLVRFCRLLQVQIILLKFKGE